MAGDRSRVGENRINVVTHRKGKKDFENGTARLRLKEVNENTN